MDFLKFINSNAIRNHLKIFICSSLIIFTLLLGGCSGKQSEPSVEPKIMVTTDAQITEEHTETVEEKDQSTAIDDSKNDGWLTYAEKYETEHHITDLYIPAKCWLVGKENIVEVISLGGMDDVTVIDHTAIERVEHTSIGEFTTISVFDKTGQSISIMVSSEDAGNLLGLIEQN